MASITPPELRWTRRDAIGARLGVVRAGVRAAGGHAHVGLQAGSAAAAALEPFQAELQVPPTLVPVSSGATEDRYEITIREGRAEIIPGTLTPVYGYDGIYPGPTIRARKGRTTVVRTTNGLPFNQNVHLHGGIVPAASDGHPMQLIAPGGSFTYTYPNAQDAASLWYHDHAHGLSARTMFYGLAGFYIVEDELEDSLDLPSGDFDVPLVIQDRAFNANGSLRYTENIDEGFLGDTIVVNGTVSPRFAVKRALYRLRFLNASNAREYRLELGTARRWSRSAATAACSRRRCQRNSVPLGPAERVDVVVDFRRFKAGAQVVLRNGLGSGNASMVMRFDVTGKSSRLGPRAVAAAAARGDPGTVREPPLGAGVLHRRRPGVADLGHRVRHRPRRRSVRRSARPSAGPSSTGRTGRTRCTCTGSTSGCSSARPALRTRASGRGRTP